ncbi:PfkB family carbohydrate kinase [Patescibacteria group bacterium AH-259-L07]|nr:PfkB family carbohydrate kinase [Patescibacteria group bacterium AH-259-L07]
MNTNITTKKFDIVIIGDITEDTIVIGEKVSTRPGGAVLYGSIPIARIVNVAVITKLAQKDSYLLHEMKKAGVSVFSIPSTKTTEFENIYPDPNNLDERIQRVKSITEPFKVQDIPKIKAKAIHVAPLTTGVINLSIIKNLAKRARFISLEVQGFIRKPKSDGSTVSVNWLKKREILSYVDILKTDRIEAEFLTKKENIREASQILASYGPQEILITSSKGLLVYAHGKFFKAPFTPRRVRGRTGRGDTCIAGYLAQRITSSPEKATRFAARLTSLKLETPGPLKYPHI